MRQLHTAPRVPAPHFSSLARQRSRQLVTTLDTWADWGPELQILQIGPGAEGEIQFLPGRTRWAVEPLAGVLADQGALRRGAVRWIAGRGEALPFETSKFDLVLLIDVLNYVENPGQVLREAARVTAPTGLVWLACDWQQAPFWRRWAQFWSLGATGRPGQLWRFTGRSLRQACQAAGLKQVPVKQRQLSSANPNCAQHLPGGAPQVWRPTRPTERLVERPLSPLGKVTA